MNPAGWITSCAAGPVARATRAPPVSSSLGDNLLRIFGGDRVAGLMNAFRVEEDTPIESGMLTRSLEGAQKKVETYYYDIRKQVFEYDEVMNNQRRAVYSERRRVLDGRALKKQVIGYGERTMGEIVEAYVNGPPLRNGI